MRSNRWTIGWELEFVAVGIVAMLIALSIWGDVQAQRRPATPPPPVPSEAMKAVAELRREMTALNDELDHLRADRTIGLALVREFEDLTPAEYRAAVRQAAAAHGLDPRLLAAQVTVETGGTWDPTLTGAAGDLGLMQIIPSTAREIAQARGVSIPDLTDPATNLDWGAWYLARLIKTANGDWREGLAAYNAGPRWRQTAPKAAPEYVERIQQKAIGK